MTLEYPVIYKDSKGTEQSTFITDGRSMRITLRNILFEGHFWELLPMENSKEELEHLFDLTEFDYTDGTKGYSVNGFSIKAEIPVKILDKDGDETDASVYFEIGESHVYCLHINGCKFNLKYPNFEAGLMPQHTQAFGIQCVKCCANCQYSEYSPYGSDTYGDLMCFRNSKEAWAKTGYHGLKGLEDWRSVLDIEYIQELFWCEEFQLKSGF